MLPTPKNVIHAPLFRPLLNVLDDVLLTADEVAQRFRLTVDTLSNQRRANVGLPFVKFETGAVRYRASDVIAYQIHGSAGPVTLNEVELAISAASDVPEHYRVRVLETVRAALTSRGKG